MISIQKLLGKDDVFFDLLEASAAEALQSAQILNKFLRESQGHATLKEFGATRRKDKQITKEIGERLVKAFVTTLEREDIESLSSALYKIPKTIEKFAERFLQAPVAVREFDFTRMAYMTEQAAGHVVEMVRALRKGSHLEAIKDINGRLQQVEGDADHLMLELMKELYSGKHDVLKVMACKDLLELLEKAVDRSRDAGNTVTYIVLKHS